MKRICLFFAFLLAVVGAGAQKIAVVSDLHYFDPSLLVKKGPAFTNYIEGDRKLIEQSSAIAEALVDALLEAAPDVVLVSGDMTKDGEVASHQGAVHQLARLREAGIKVCVVAGNHDINNFPDAMAFDGDKKTPVPTVSPTLFELMYGDMGYRDAIHRGPDLCYVSEPVEGVWIIAMDAAQYMDNENREWAQTEGYLSPEKVDWAVAQTHEGIQQNKKVFGLMHQGLVEHFVGQATIFSDYIIPDNETIANRLAEAGMSALFTGHFHAQDITIHKTPTGRAIYDIETGSTVTYPCPYRLMELRGDTLDIETRHLTVVPRARKFLENGLGGSIRWMLSGEPYHLSDAEIETLTPLMIETLVAHYIGDEDTAEMSDEGREMLKSLYESDRLTPVGQGVSSMWWDMVPADNNVSLYLEPKQPECD